MLHGPGTNWTRIETPMLSTNKTYPCDAQGNCGVKHDEFVTSNYFGAVPGDPAGGKTRVFTANQRATTYYIGEQSNGGPLTVDYAREGAVGVIDFGDYTMARTFGSDPNQVNVEGRRVIVGWILSTPASQSLARDLSFAPDRTLLQQFVPELQQIRKTATHRHTITNESAHAGQQLEVFARFALPPIGPPAPVPAGDGWAPVLSKGVYGMYDIGADGFSTLLSKSSTKLIRRDCPVCNAEAATIFYKRLTPLGTLDLFDALKSNWTDDHNVLNTDFELYSTLTDALAGNKAARWMYCNYDDPCTPGYLPTAYQLACQSDNLPARLPVRRFLPGQPCYIRDLCWLLLLYIWRFFAFCRHLQTCSDARYGTFYSYTKLTNQRDSPPCPFPPSTVVPTRDFTSCKYP